MSATSLALIRRAGAPRDAAIIDVGGGASTLIDALLDDGHTDVTVLDIAERRARGERSRSAPHACGSGAALRVLPIPENVIADVVARDAELGPAPTAVRWRFANAGGPMEQEPRYGRYWERDDEHDRRYARRREVPVYRGPLRHAPDWREVEPYGWDERARWSRGREGEGYGRYAERGYGYGRYGDEEASYRAMRGEGRWDERDDRMSEREEHGLADRLTHGIRSFFRGERGPHRGKGPKGYRRSDERIREDVCDYIAETGWVDASDVEVRVQNGEVTLSGTVATRRDKRMLEDLVEEVPGVEDVHNQLRVRRDAERGSVRSPGPS